jgi:hypothetical protein
MPPRHSRGSLKKGETDLLPCAGITLIRFTGIISACCVATSTPGTIKAFYNIKNWDKNKLKKIYAPVTFLPAPSYHIKPHCL